ncbi:sigma factor-like helix-turn-helix DNA-binding protein [Streptomyces sp. TLI_185]|uniref:sigma factor-like helix-turn-helix DNA-binding protein n=1 Tax=Streptomyces sp. TLI_185 TaxID=2485151 RepID=UPI0037DA2FA8
MAAGRIRRRIDGERLPVQRDVQARRLRRGGQFLDVLDLTVRHVPVGRDRGVGRPALLADLRPPDRRVGADHGDDTRSAGDLPERAGHRPLGRGLGDLAARQLPDDPAALASRAVRGVLQRVRGSWRRAGTHRRILDALPERSRAILELRFLRGCTIRRAAAELGVPWRTRRSCSIASCTMPRAWARRTTWKGTLMKSAVDRYVERLLGPAPAQAVRRSPPPRRNWRSPARRSSCGLRARTPPGHGRNSYRICSVVSQLSTPLPSRLPRARRRGLPQDQAGSWRPPRLRPPAPPPERPSIMHSPDLSVQPAVEPLDQAVFAPAAEERNHPVPRRKSAGIARGWVGPPCPTARWAGAGSGARAG